MFKPCFGYRYEESDENKNILYIDAKKLYGWVVSQYVPYDETKYNKKVDVGDILKTEDFSGFGYSIVVDLNYPGNIKNRNFPFCPYNKNLFSRWLYW